MLDCEEDGLGGTASVAVNMYKLCALEKHEKTMKIHGTFMENGWKMDGKWMEIL